MIFRPKFVRPAGTAGDFSKTYGFPKVTHFKPNEECSISAIAESISDDHLKSFRGSFRQKMGDYPVIKSDDK